ncbi:MAG: hypothetical protein RL701_3915 [Pseudomonadota bacterium]
MPQWVCAAKIVSEYVVAEAKLLEYSARGNLPCRRGPDGVYFDLERVVRLFRARGAEGESVVSGANLGTLGGVKLGGEREREHTQPSSPVRRQRLVRNSPQASEHARVRVDSAV